MNKFICGGGISSKYEIPIEKTVLEIDPGEYVVGINI